MDKKFKSGFAAIIGKPNVGKSTLLNKIIGEKVAIMSHKAQTTRNKITAILTEDNYQIVFLDTPGIHKPKNKLGEYMTKVTQEALEGIDVILFIVSANKPIDDNQIEIIKEFEKIRVPIILVINKVDLIDKTSLLSLIQKYNNLYNFKSTIPISALKGDGIDIIKNEIINLLPAGPKYFPDDIYTDQIEKQIISEIIREKTLKFLNEEVPHGIAVEVLTVKDRKTKNIIDIMANIYCEKSSHKGIILGKKGAMLKKIGNNSRIDIEKLLGCKVFLQLWVKVKKDWRNNEFFIKDLGYK